MSDTAPGMEEPFLDLDAMLEDLAKGFPESESFEVSEDQAAEPPIAESENAQDTGTPSDSTDDGGFAAGGEEVDDADTSSFLPPGMVEFAGEIIPIEEAQALLNLNRQVKEDPDKAARVRDAIIGTTEQTIAPTLDPYLPASAGYESESYGTASDLPGWIDPHDTQAVNLYRQNVQTQQQLAEMRRLEEVRQQQVALTQEEARRNQVVDAWRDAMQSFHSQHPGLDMTDLKGIADRAAELKLLDSPEAVGGSLRGGFEVALDTAMWATPQYREKALAGDTVATKEQQSQDRKRKASALSSTSGSSPRTQSTEAAPTTRQEVLSAGLSFLRSQGPQD